MWAKMMRAKTPQAPWLPELLVLGTEEQNLPHTYLLLIGYACRSLHTLQVTVY